MFEKGFLQKISIKQGVQMVGMIFKHALKYNRKAEVLFKTGWRKLKMRIHSEHAYDAKWREYARSEAG